MALNGWDAARDLKPMHLSEWVYWGMAAKYWNTDPIALQARPEGVELAAQAFDLMQIDSQTQHLARIRAEREAKNKPKNEQL